MLGAHRAFCQGRDLCGAHQSNVIHSVHTMHFATEFRILASARCGPRKWDSARTSDAICVVHTTQMALAGPDSACLGAICLVSTTQMALLPIASGHSSFYMRGVCHTSGISAAHRRNCRRSFAWCTPHRLRPLAKRMVCTEQIWTQTSRAK